MSIDWFEKRPGGHPIARDGLDGCVMLVGGGPPDWVRVPDEIGGGIRRVLGVFEAPCPVSGEPCQHYQLEGGLFVAESDQFRWYVMHEEGRG